VVNGATLNLAGGNLPAGGLTLNGGGFTQTVGVIDPTNIFTLNGNSTVTLAGTNTFAGLVFNNNGGSLAPTLSTGTVGWLNVAEITANSGNPGSVATITGTLDFGGTGRTITVGSIQTNGVSVAPWTPTLSIAANIQNAGSLSVSGGGVLQLSGSSTFSGGVNVAGDTSLLLASGTTSTLTSGPLGTGLLTLANGASVLFDSGARSVGNAVLSNGSVNFGGINSGTLSGAFSLADTTTFNVGILGVATTLSGSLSTVSGNGAVLAKEGRGTLVLGGSASATTLNTAGAGSILINNGVLELQGADTAFGALGMTPALLCPTISCSEAGS
jgi:autotransporter-associated beta strand protein